MWVKQLQCNRYQRVNCSKGRAIGRKRERGGEREGSGGTQKNMRGAWRELVLYSLCGKGGEEKVIERAAKELPEYDKACSTS